MEREWFDVQFPAIFLHLPRLSGRLPSRRSTLISPHLQKQLTALEEVVFPLLYDKLADIGLFRQSPRCSVLNMAAERKAILTSGLGAFATNDPNAQAVFGTNAGARVQELLQTSIDKANAAGFDLVRCDANTQDYEDTLRRFTETLNSRKFAGLNIGYGLRGHKGKSLIGVATQLV